MVSPSSSIAIAKALLRKYLGMSFTGIVTIILLIRNQFLWCFLRPSA
jgi:hypothetical protein